MRKKQNKLTWNLQEKLFFKKQNKFWSWVLIPVFAEGTSMQDGPSRPHSQTGRNLHFLRHQGDEGGMRRVDEEEEEAQMTKAGERRCEKVEHIVPSGGINISKHCSFLGSSGFCLLRDISLGVIGIVLLTQVNPITNDNSILIKAIKV